MATSASPEASDIRRRGRQRLIGAVVLVALLVVFVPMLLDSEPKPARESPNLAIPPKDPAQPLPTPAPKVVPDTPKAAPATAEKPVPGTPADKGAVAATDKPAAATDKSVPGTPTAAAASRAAPETATKPAPEPAAKVATVTPSDASKSAPGAEKIAPAAPAAAAQGPRSGFAVQVGAFRDEAKLKQARDKLAAAKVPHYTERLESKGGGLTRLRAGPFETREKAEAALASLKRASLDGKVVPLP